MSAGYELREAGVSDAEAYVRCHVACLAETYATIMPAAFAEQQRRAVPQRVAETRRAWAAAADKGGSTSAWLATDVAGLTVGVASSGGPQDWEVALGAPAADVDFQLHHIYALRRTHGSGLGQSLLDLAVGERQAYLWILHGNPRAERFYRRNGFAPDGTVLTCGPTWFYRPMFRMSRVDDAARSETTAPDLSGPRS